MQPVFLLCAFPALSPVLLASDEKAPASTPQADSHSERATPALFSWGDVDDDGRLELAAVSADGTLQLLRNTLGGRFEDVTEGLGLSGVENAALALWADYDRDLRLDLFVGAREGQSRLFHNEGGIFVDMSAGSGLLSEGAVQFAHWLDHDGDGRLDLHVVTVEKNELFRGLEGGFFERVELPLAGAGNAPVLGGFPLNMDGLGAPSGPESPDAGGSKSGTVSLDDLNVPGNRISLGPTPGGVAPLGPFPLACASSIKDQANPGSCLQASSTPTLGMLYPISANLFVAVGGNVGIGTTSPAARLEVAGTARMTDTLTLAPSGDQALDISTGSIYKGGALFIHTKGGSSNTALGRLALSSVTSGFANTASGHKALSSNTSGFRNTAGGSYALSSNTTGFGNTASGYRALFTNTNGFQNTACGYRALESNTSIDNTANGYSALRYNTDGFRNTASGAQALLSNTTGSYNTALGYSALRFNTTGNSNTASGFRALSFNTTGFGNTASGSRALYSNTTGYRNTASGFRALFSNTTGDSNTASGYRALRSNTIGDSNTASGFYALYSNSTGCFNTACGVHALSFNTTGNDNTACGVLAMFFNSTGRSNTACGTRALFYSTSGNDNTASGIKALYSNITGTGNTACGKQALYFNQIGHRNIALGQSAGFNLTGSDNVAIANSGIAGESGTIRIGTAELHTRVFIAGIRGVTTGLANAIPVLIDGAGQLGTVSSSRRFKKDIADMGDLTERLLGLRPVVFRYKEEQQVKSGEVPLEYGLIAEEVAEVFPDLVVNDEEGQPFTVKYHLLSSMLLNELKRLDERMQAQTNTHALELEELRSELTRLRGLEERLAALESQTSPATQFESIPTDNR